VIQEGRGVLVLRRRAQEAIVFEGGLVVTLVDVTDHRAWLAFSSPSIPARVVVSTLGITPETTCVAVRSPASVTHDGRVTSVSVSADDGPSDDDTVLLVNRRLGERIDFDGLGLEVASIDQGRTVLRASVAEVEGPVGVSVFSVSGSEVKIGIDAPDTVRVYREEVWHAMRTANEGAAAWSSSDLAALAGTPLPGGTDRP
jgi:carbon storage regulator